MAARHPWNLHFGLVKPTRPAVIMGLTATGLAAVRTLGAMGVPSLGLYWRREIGRHSRYLRSVVRVPHWPSHDQLRSALDELTEPWRESSPILLPASDVYAEFLDEMQDELRPSYTLRCARTKLHAAFVDKARTIRLCTDHGVRIPLSRAIDTTEDLSAVCRDFRFPVIVKPRSFLGVDFPGKNFVARTPDELSAFFGQQPEQLGHTVAQQVVRGGDGKIVMSISYSGGDGRVLALTTLRKLRQWRPDYGVTCLGRSESLPEVAAISTSFLDDIGYQGFAAIEFAEDGSGRYHLLEVNPRLNLPTQLALDANVNVVRTAYLEMSGAHEAAAPPPRQTDHVYWVDFRSDLHWLLKKHREGEISLASFGSWLRSVWRASSYATYDWRDLRPFVDSSLELARDLLVLFGAWTLQAGAGLARRFRGGRNSRISAKAAADIAAKVQASGASSWTTTYPANRKT
jgi:D-aspartate ligase